MDVQETIDYVRAMKRTAEKDTDPRAVKCIEACSSILKLIDQRRLLQNRCYALSGGCLCGFCGMECSNVIKATIERGME